MPEQKLPPPVQVTTIEHRVDYATDPMPDYSQPEHGPADTERADDGDQPRGGTQL